MHPSPCPPLGRVCAAAFAALAACPSIALAQTLAAATLPGVVVTATRTPQPIASVLADLRVIDSDEIERAVGATLPELLQRAGGVEITANGGPGQPAGVFVRGSNPNHVVVLIDGVRVNSATTGANAFEHIPLQQIERIEILRGPASSLYGADAIGGVIQIFTRSGERTHARLGTGRRRTHEASAGIGRSVGATKLALDVGWRRSRSFSATNEANAFAFDPDDDAHRNANLGLRAEHEWSGGHSVALRALASASRTLFDSGPGSDDLSRQRVATLALESRNRIAPQWQSLVRIAQGSDHLDVEGSFPSSFDTDQQQLTWQNDLGPFVAGAEWRREKVGGSTAYSRTQRDIRSLFGAYSAALDALSLHASLRHDDNTQFGARTTGKLALGWSVAPAWRVGASAGTAFRAPSFNDLYFPLSFGFSGNPDLRPERSRSAELSLRFDGGALGASAVLFENRIRDLIAVDPTFTTVVNVNRARIRGATVGATYRSGAWNARAEWTHQQPIDADSGTRLTRRARNHASASLTADLGACRAGVEWVGSGARFDTAANTPASRMGGYALFNVHAAYALRPQWSLLARIDNAADKRYELAQGYNTARRGAFVALEYAAR